MHFGLHHTFIKGQVFAIGCPVVTSMKHHQTTCSLHTYTHIGIQINTSPYKPLSSSPLPPTKSVVSAVVTGEQQVSRDPISNSSDLQHQHMNSKASLFNLYNGKHIAPSKTQGSKCNSVAFTAQASSCLTSIVI